MIHEAYPHYLLIGQNNEIVSFDANDPSHKDELLNDINLLLKGNKTLVKSSDLIQNAQPD